MRRQLSRQVEEGRAGLAGGGLRAGFPHGAGKQGLLGAIVAVLASGSQQPVEGVSGSSCPVCPLPTPYTRQAQDKAAQKDPLFPICVRDPHDGSVQAAVSVGPEMAQSMAGGEVCIQSKQPQTGSWLLLPGEAHSFPICFGLHRALAVAPSAWLASSRGTGSRDQP